MSSYERNGTLARWHIVRAHPMHRIVDTSKRDYLANDVSEQIVGHRLPPTEIGANRVLPKHFLNPNHTRPHYKTISSPTPATFRHHNFNSLVHEQPQIHAFSAALSYQHRTAPCRDVVKEERGLEREVRSAIARFCATTSRASPSRRFAAWLVVVV